MVWFKYANDKERILRNISVMPSGCWEWQLRYGYNRKWSKAQYGEVAIPTGKRGSRKVLAHRLSYEAFVGPITDGLWVLHSCDNTLCCNPDHLFLGTSEDNVNDCKRKNRTAAGEFNGNAKITTNDVLTIRRMAWVFRLPHKCIADLYGLSASHVYGIVTGRSWRCIGRGSARA
jgi:hypothetical protein